jgi:hypothetical protein
MVRVYSHMESVHKEETERLSPNNPKNVPSMFCNLERKDSSDQQCHAHPIQKPF